MALYNNPFNTLFYQQDIQNSYQNLFDQINSQMANAYPQNQNLTLGQMINTANQCSAAPNLEQKILTEKINKLEQENQKLKEEIQTIVEKEDDKQKILKITAATALKNDINAETVIVYGNISGNISSKNVICIKGSIEGDVKAEKVIAPSYKKNEKATISTIKNKYRKLHPSCEYCKYRFFPTHWSRIPRCRLSEKAVDDFIKIRAIFCKYYEPKEDIE